MIRFVKLVLYYFVMATAIACGIWMLIINAVEVLNQIQHKYTLPMQLTTMSTKEILTLSIIESVVYATLVIKLFRSLFLKRVKQGVLTALGVFIITSGFIYLEATFSYRFP